MYKQSDTDYKRLLNELIESIEISSNAYDSGYFGEAKRLATTLRILLHDTSKSTSLFKQLGIKHKLKYCATPSPYGPRNILTECQLVKVRIGQEMAYEPILDEFPSVFKWQRMSFDQWWNEKIIRDKKGQITTRKELILAVANQDGGAHVDPKLDEKYADLSRRNSLNWVPILLLHAEVSQTNVTEAVRSSLLFRLLHNTQSSKRGQPPRFYFVKFS